MSKSEPKIIPVALLALLVASQLVAGSAIAEAGESEAVAEVAAEATGDAASQAATMELDIDADANVDAEDAAGAAAAAAAAEAETLAQEAARDAVAIAEAEAMARAIDDAQPAAQTEVASEIDWFEIGATTLDAAVLRPLGVLSTLGGMAFFVATAPITAPTGGLETAWDVYVYGSYDYTFVRPLGEL